MIKTLKKVILSSLSILGISFVFWLVLFLNPSLSYANKTQVDFISIYHNQPLEAEAEAVIRNAAGILKKSDLFKDEVSIHFCMNDDKLYPNLHPLAGQPLAYAFLNKTIAKNCKLNFGDNTAETQWAINQDEIRKFNLTWLLAHEFTHNLQYRADRNYVIRSTMGSLNWKLEGHAEYIAREFKGDGLLKAKIDKFLLEEQKEFKGLPVFELEDGTQQILSYYKYALAIQYLMEEKGLDFEQICSYETDLDVLFDEMIDWKNTTTE
ncbi:MAG: collagenase [Saprospiraceae bacterium]|nr:collagenase [Saprospiraceae bacterium]